MINFRLYFDKDKETIWLNEMAEKGYAMTGFFAGFYHFEKCEQGKYVYQIDFGDGFFSVSNDYREFMAETDIEVIQCWGPWVFLRKKASEGEFRLYTDVDSNIAHYSKIRKMFKMVIILEIFCFMTETFAAAAGNFWAVVCLLIISAFIIVMMRALVRTNQIIAELKERKGEPMNKCGRPNGRVSLFLPCGLILNSCSMLLRETIPHTIWIIISIIAIILMWIGIFRSRRVFKD